MHGRGLGGLFIAAVMVRMLIPIGMFRHRKKGVTSRRTLDNTHKKWYTPLSEYYGGSIRARGKRS